MKGRSEFTVEEIGKLKNLISKKCDSSRSEQKKIRHRIRNEFGLRWEDDFHPKRESPRVCLTVENFEALIKEGKIKVKG